MNNNDGYGQVPQNFGGRNPAPERLYRSNRQRWVLGVCGGLAERFNIDVTIVRLLMVASLLLPGPQIIFYIVAAIIIPAHPNQ